MFPQQPHVQVRFVNIGQGDCTYIVSPGNKRILVDAGNSGWGNATIESVQRDLLCFMGEMIVPLEILILTHNDADHYNKIGDAIGGVQVNRLYYSNLLPRYSAYAFRCWRWGTGRYRRREANVAAWNTINVNPTRRTPQVIFTETAPNGQVFNLTVLAANVEAPNLPADGDSAVQRNTRSIVVRGSFAGNSFIIGADATNFTENFLVGNTGQTNGELMSDVVRVPHHGSADSSTPEFVSDVDADYAIISCKNRGSSRYQIPRRSAYDAYNTLTAQNAANHQVGYYDNVGVNNTLITGVRGLAYQTINTTSQIYETGISGTQTFYFLQDGTYYMG